MLLFATGISILLNNIETFYKKNWPCRYANTFESLARYLEQHANSLTQHTAQRYTTYQYGRWSRLIFHRVKYLRQIKKMRMELFPLLLSVLWLYSYTKILPLMNETRTNPLLVRLTTERYLQSLQTWRISVEGTTRGILAYKLGAALSQLILNKGDFLDLAQRLYSTVDGYIVDTYIVHGHTIDQNTDKNTRNDASIILGLLRRYVLVFSTEWHDDVITEAIVDNIREILHELNRKNMNTTTDTAK